MTTNPDVPRTTDDPEVLRAQIAQTRASLSRDVNALGEAVSPSNVAKRQAEKVTGSVKDAGRSLKEKIMGSDNDPYDTSPGMGMRAQWAAEDAGGAVGDAAASARDAVANAPSTVRRQAQGNPLAAGLIALGAGWLLGSLLPGTEKERELAVTAKEQAQEHGQPLVEEVKAAAQEVVENVRPQAEQAAEELRTTAQEGVDSVKDEASSQTEQVKASAQDSAQSVKETNDRT
ncbi:DUF3618 domain-containing protein [Ornithinimicrobium flavum]|uniref:DUF3618 domain-containing protein n=1 Tax=Ornithinimicrobium flavum TaxID=1288636 RepID=UPI001070502F|nr:DUF3618 domain-containing protein [Ornithinimicrobium flavum]